MKLLASKLRALIKSHGHTMTSFGRELSLTRNGAYDILKRKYLKPDAIEKICKVLSVRPEEFIDYEFPDAKEKLNKEISRITELEKTNLVLEKERAVLERESVMLREKVKEKIRLFEMATKIIQLQEQSIKRQGKRILELEKILSQALHPKSRKS